MPNTQDLRRKIKSVKDTGKLTRAMQMVAASKMNKATTAATASRTYANQAWAILGDLASRSEATHELFTPKAEGRKAIILISSNRGLAGSFNSQLFKLVSPHIDQQTDLITIGRKGVAYYRRFRPDNLVADFPASDSTPGSAEAEPIAQMVIKGFQDGTYRQVDVAYNQFVSTLVQQPVIEQLLPIQPKESEEPEAPRTSGNDEFLVEPDPQTVLDALAGRIVPLRLYQMLLESSASEHSARMIAMKNATDNAGEIVDDLTLTYQSVRQANITREIIEVSAGANALAG